MKAGMRILLLNLLSVGVVFAGEYSIIAFSTKYYSKRDAKIFLKRFHNGIIKQYSDFVEYKIEPFDSYQSAKNYLKYIKKYYKHPLIIPYRPNLGRIIAKGSSNNNTIFYKNHKMYYALPLSKCENSCIAKKESWDISKNKILSKLKVNVKNYLPKGSQPSYIASYTPENEIISNTKKSKCLDNSEKLNFYVEGYADIYDGQQYQTKSLAGDSEYIKGGLIYDKKFADYWRLYADSRIVIRRSATRNSVNSDLYLDIKNLYLRSYCFLYNWANLLVGRKVTKDNRSWWYDKSLDQIRLFSESTIPSYELIFATRLSSELLTSKQSSYYLLRKSKIAIFHGNYDLTNNDKVHLYYMYENVKPNYYPIKKQNIRNYGLAYYRDDNNNKYWVNLNYSKGNRVNFTNNEKVNGLGFDIGAKFQYNKKFAFALSYAYGAKHFVQPYIASNYSDFLKKDFKFKYYGFVLNPKLENLNIFSLYGILDLTPEQILILAYHSYFQNSSKVVYYDDTYFYPTNGKNKNIGNELDLFYKIYLKHQQNVKVGVGYFVGDNAFDYLKSSGVFRMFVDYKKYWK